MKREQQDALLQKIIDGVRIMAIRHAVSHEQAMDFLQEGLVCALFAIPKYADKEPEDLLKILAKCAYNRIITLQTNAVTHEQRSLPLDVLDSLMQEDFEDILENESFIRVLKGRLNAVTRKVFEERINPSIDTLNVVEEDKRRKMHLHKRGHLVMGRFSDEVKGIHIAKALGISKATVSRSLKEIALEGEKLLRSQLEGLLPGGRE